MYESMYCSMQSPQHLPYNECVWKKEVLEVMTGGQNECGVKEPLFKVMLLLWQQRLKVLRARNVIDISVSHDDQSDKISTEFALKIRLAKSNSVGSLSVAGTRFVFAFACLVQTFSTHACISQRQQQQKCYECSMTMAQSKGSAFWITP